jgi:DNA-binding CsgD family transcriptional regulator
MAEAALERASMPSQPLVQVEARLILARLAQSANGIEEAERNISAALALAEQCAAPWEIARARIASAEQHIAAGRLEPARELLESSRSLAARLEAHPLITRIDALSAAVEAPRGVASAPAGLSRRELDVLRLVARGLTNAEIAIALYISPRTVEQHLRRIYFKIDARSRSAATRYAIEHGIE